ncbi:hypothetical protein Mtc_0412 [Methanocella conradii HZ254]|uniref:PD-(D/E)XK motif protein n=1 Tax=Methanocella conradii (strain DSM 24694 / JCM 17849 / CGMCC 1.5162 / HZ254) TaxID=1041930 RepID=H8I440_METCZ|nr:PD-(D/E)XK motif protein [Methanocella conradii]AFC99179.1 hypothetical protein Mtc_0412 [Methanocella conradii HZ254]
MSIISLYNQVKNAKLDSKYKAIIIPGANDVFLASDETGRPCLFLKSNENNTWPSLHTERISLCLNKEYLLLFQDGTRAQGKYNALLCLSDMPEDIDTFLTLLEAFIIHSKNVEIRTEEIISFFYSLARLFAIKPDENIKSRRQGLWGELLMMRSIKGYAFWAPFWHIESNRLFDFSMQGKRIEVKTTTKPNRIHSVSHSQVYSLGNDDILIASILLKEDDSGVSLRTLISECREALKRTQYYFKIENAIRHANMQNPSEEGPKFNINDAERSLRWYNSENVPRFESEEPEGVSGTHYMIDLTNSIAVEHAWLSDWLNQWHT